MNMKAERKLGSEERASLFDDYFKISLKQS